MFDDDTVTIYPSEYSVVVSNNNPDAKNGKWKVLTATYASDPEAGLNPLHWNFVLGAATETSQSATLCLVAGSSQELGILAHEPIFLRVKFPRNQNCEQLIVSLG